MINYIKKNFSNENSPQVSVEWIKKTKEERINEIKKLISTYIEYEKFEVVNIVDDGQVIFKIFENIPASKRGESLLILEDLLKLKIDKGITVWLEPVGDKSKLRNLRGIKFENEK